jgi:hypothetical protein
MEETKKEVKPKGEILHRGIQGRVTLEFYKDHGHIIAIRGNKEIFWVEFSEFAKLYQEFEEIVIARTKKPSNAKVSKPL